MLRPEGCEGVEWIREHFGDPVAVTQEFIRHAFLHYRGIGVCGFLDKHVPAALQAEHLAYVNEAKAEFRDSVTLAENALALSGDVAAYDQAIAQAFCRHRGKRYGALEGAFTTRFDPYY
jgi:hypothetical protein